MDKFNVYFLQTALDDIEEIEMYIAADNANAAITEYNQILDQTRQLEMFPMLVDACPDPKLNQLGFQMLVCGKCLLFYKVLEGECLIMRVVHGARDYPKLLGYISDDVE